MGHEVWQQPLFDAPTGWEAPRELPDLRYATQLAIDLETFDPGIERGVGSSAVRGEGHIAGIAVGTEDHRWYFPIGHGSGLNMNPVNVLDWARDLAAQREDRLWIGANLAYDLEWLRTEGVRFRGRFFDVQYAAALLDEERMSYSLESLSQDYLGEGKVSNELYHHLATMHKCKPTRDATARYIWTAPPSKVGPYAESDVDLPFKLFQKFWPAIREAELTEVCRLEMRLIPLLLEMRFKGVRVDLERAERTKRELRTKINDIVRELRDLTSVRVDIWSADSLKALCDAVGVFDYGWTPNTGKPSFRKEWLERHEHPMLQRVALARKYDKLISTFIDSYIIGSQINGRVHTQFHPLRGDDGGTVSGRFSSSNPNLQNIPARDKEAKRLLRSCFIPDDPGHVWAKFDYSQVEYRLLAHEAVGRGAETIRARYRDDPSTDYHEATRQQIKDITGILLDRAPTKNINFGLAYGMQIKKLAAGLGMTVEDAQPLFDAYHSGVPFVQETFNKFQREARATGEVRTILGRRRCFKLFGPRAYDGGGAGLPWDKAIERWGHNNVRRLDVHKGLNQRLQGSAADIMKKAMVEGYESGAFNETGIPLLTVHDELDFSAPPDCAGFARVREVMETCVDLRVPLVCEPSFGPNWGETE